jgi:hypothetical protein
MRKFMALLLLAGAAVPSVAMAGPIDKSDEAKPEHSDRHQAQQQQQQQQQSDDNGSPRGDRSGGNNDRPHFSGYGRPNGGDQSPAAVQVDRGNRGDGGQSIEAKRQQFGGYQNSGGYQNNGGDGGQSIEAKRQHFGGYQRDGGGPDAAVQKTYGGNPSGSESNWRAHERRPIVQEQADQQQGWTAQNRDPNDSLRQFDRPPPNVMRSRVPVVSNVPREGTQPPQRATRQWSGRNQGHWNGNWNGNWRNDHRYNWQDRRRHHRSLFRLGVYFDPFGWGYQRYSIGWRLWPNYYSSNYWFNPTQYGLPYAPPGYQWVRYYDDALLVDTWSGQVVDVIYSFFW